MIIGESIYDILVYFRHYAERFFRRAILEPGDQVKGKAVNTGKLESPQSSCADASAAAVSIESAVPVTSEKTVHKTAGVARRLWPYLPEVAGLAVLFAVLGLLQKYEFLLFHALGEIFSVVIAGSIFMLARVTRESTGNGAVRLLGAASLSIGMIDLLHTLAYPGMGSIAEFNSGNTTTQLWIAARFLQAGTFALVPLVARKRISFTFTTLAYLSISAVLLHLIFATDLFPQTFIEGKGLTNFKVSAEYAIIALLVTGGFLLWLKRDAFDARVRNMLFAAVGVSALSEYFFSAYREMYDPTNAMGHYLKIVAFFFIYKALFDTSVREPTTILFRDLAEAQRRQKLENRIIASANRILETFVRESDTRMYDKVLAVLQEETGAESGIFGYIDESGVLVCPTLSRMLDTCKLKGKCIEFPPDRWKGTWGEALRRQQAIVTNEPSPVPDCHVPVENNMAVPILFHESPVGLFNLANKPKGFNEADQAFLTSLAERIAPILYAWVQKEFRNRERITAEEKLRESAVRYKHLAEDLSAANQELESFSYSVSHDLRSPLRAMKGFSGFLLEDYSAQIDDTGKDYLNRIIKGSERMDRLIDDMLHLSRVSRQEMVIHKINLTSMACSIFEDLRYGDPKRNVSTFVDEHIPAMGDSRLLTIVMTNLLSNAWKYTAKTEIPRIEFWSEKRDGQQVFMVRDNGSGFDQRYADNLFAPFKRLHSDTEFPGTGIGLAIVHRVIKRHRGHIWAEGEVGKGATFFFTLGVDEPQSSTSIQV